MKIFETQALPDGGKILTKYNPDKKTDGHITLPSGITAVGERAFYDCAEIRSVAMPDTVVSIGASAFYGCTGLAEIHLSRGLKSIGSFAFNNCRSLTDIDLPEGLETLSTYAFEGCSSVTSLTLPTSLRYISDACFQGMTSLTEFKMEEGGRGFTVRDGVLYSADMTALIRYPTGREEDEFTLPRGVKVLSESCMSGADLSRIALPPELESIHSFALGNMPRLEELNLPRSLKYIDDYALSGSKSIDRLTVDPANGNYRAEGGALLSKNGSTFIMQIVKLTEPDLTLPAGVRTVGSRAFIAHSEIRSVTLPSSVTKIEDEAFFGCKNLEWIHLGRNIQSVSPTALKGCQRLKEIRCEGTKEEMASALNGDALPFGVKPEIIYGVEPRDDKQIEDENVAVPAKDDQSLADMRENLSLYLYQTLTDGGYEITGVKSKLHTELIIPEGVRRIGRDAFSGCERLERVLLPLGLEEIGSNAFALCRKLYDINLPRGLRKLGHLALYCTDISEITLPRSLISVGDRALSGCQSLRRIEVEEGNEHYLSRDGHLYGITNMGTMLIQYAPACPDSEFVCPDCQMYISPMCFAHAKNLRRIHLPESVFSICDSAFCNCTALAEINIPEGLLSIQTRAFAGCKSLTSVVLNINLQELGFCAFEGCTKLSYAFIPKYLKKLNPTAFNNCPSLKRVCYEGGRRFMKQIEVDRFYRDEMRKLKIKYNCKPKEQKK